jgi:hypothetical protein
VPDSPSWKPVIWSHSALRMYEQCPRKYNETYNLKAVPFEQTEMTRYGDRFHAAARDFIMDGTDMPPEFVFSEKTLSAIKKIPGEKHAEMKMGVNPDLEPVAFFGKDVWSRGAADLIIHNKDARCAYVVDYKTGKDTHPEMDQLVLMSLFVFAWFKKVDTVRSALLYVVKDSLVPFKMRRSETHAAWQAYKERVALLEATKVSGVWNPRENFSCKRYCQVKSCEYWGP